MRSVTAMPACGPERGGRTLTNGEIVIVVVIMILAASLAVAGLPMFGILEFVGAVAFLACRTLERLRAPRPAEGL
ncbi:hypothetical protein GCM10010495_48170 [Kitasatospora herbaricolor]|uniref:hypothetical protein n=1 Tax=Kitasatospora herbaricolor TaxID=68217 RepID=UPI00174C3E8E|nr:hypothetical protein [Kitasatospora herbaricolor]MDQ0305815.1 hypothetical protein [Kitasatospora herbaricolor]GGV26654.1 hypothetical protein GCM10010495_48170 [Kitasatospora herbaricolor]